MLRKLARRVLFLLVGLAVVEGIVYAGIQFAATRAADQRAAEIEKHREAQRAQSTPPASQAAAPTAPAAPPTAAPNASPATEQASPAAVAASAHRTSFRGPDRDGHYRQQPVRTDWGVVAYDRQSGKRVWSALDDGAAYSSPMLVTLGGVRQIVTFTSTRLVGLAPENGQLLWELAWMKTNQASQPLIAGPDRVFVSTGDGSDAAMLQLAAGADGQLTARELWRTTRMNTNFSSPVLHDGFIYGLDGSNLACIDASTGELKWKGGRYGSGQVMLASGHLIVLTDQGELALVRADPKAHQEVTRFPGIDGKTWNHPAG